MLPPDLGDSQQTGTFALNPNLHPVATARGAVTYARLIVPQAVATGSRQF